MTDTDARFPRSRPESEVEDIKGRKRPKGPKDPNTQTPNYPLNPEPWAQLLSTPNALQPGRFCDRNPGQHEPGSCLGRPGIQVAAITRRADGYYIVHVESSKEGDYPLVNGTPIGPQAHKLHDNDVVQLVGVKMGFFVG